MERTTKKRWEIILARCKRCIEKVEKGTNKTIKEHDEIFHENLYDASIRELDFLLAHCFGDEQEITYGERIADLKNSMGDLD